MNIKVGDRVRDLVDVDFQGTVTSIKNIDVKEIEVLWDSESSAEPMDLGEIRIIDPIAEAKMIESINLKLTEATSAFEKAFTTFYEATRLAETEHYWLRGSEFPALKSLEKVIEDNGWRSSSLFC